MFYSLYESVVLAYFHQIQKLAIHKVVVVVVAQVDAFEDRILLHVYLFFFFTFKFFVYHFYYILTRFSHL